MEDFDYTDQLERLSSENIALKAEVSRLLAEISKLRDRLGLTSKNSSIPSSKELYKIKKGHAKSSSRNQGAQPGHTGKSRTKMESDEVVSISLPSTCDCGGSISLSSKPYTHQKVDIPPIKPYVVTYHLAHGRCKKCGKRKSATLPAGVSNDTFGPRLKSILSTLTGFYKNSKREVTQILKDLFGLDISLGSIINTESRVSSKCQSSYQALEQEIGQSPLVHIDETSHYHKGKLGWAWMFTNDTHSLLQLTDSRSKKVLENSPLGPTSAIIVTDRYAAYNYFSASFRQLCWSHLARDFERMAHSWHKEVKLLGVGLSQIARELFSLKQVLFKGILQVPCFLRRARKLRKRMGYDLKNILAVPDPIHAMRVAKNMLKDESMIWKFLENPLQIPLTNNHAERQIRHYVEYRKHSYFTQSQRGNQYLERIISLYLTWKQQHKNPFQELLQIVA